MARIDADGSGVILRVAHTAALEAVFPDAHPGTAAQLSIDETQPANEALLADLLANPGGYRLIGGVLTKSGVAQAVAADSAETTYRKALATLLQGQRDYLALGSPTAAQTTQAVQSHAKLLLLLAKLAQRNGWV